MDRLLSMRVFERVVDEGSFAGAARVLDLAPAVVTRLVEDLERSLSARLLHRTTRSLSLTPAGEAYLGRIRPTQEMAGTLRLCANSATALIVLAPGIAEFQAMHPAVNFEVQVSETPTAEIEHFDLTFLRDDEKLDADVVVRPVLPFDLVLCGTPEYLRANGTPRTPEDLVKHRVLRDRLPGSRVRSFKLVHPEDGRAVEVDAPAPLIANDSNTINQASLAGAGLSLFPEPVTVPLIATGRLVRVLAPWVGAEKMRLLAAMPSRRYTPLRTRAFLEFAVDYAHRRAGDNPGTFISDSPQQASPPKPASRRPRP